MSSIVSASSFWLRQLQRSRRSLDIESAATLVHSFVASRIDYCNAVLAGASKATSNKLQRVLNAAARVVSGTHKFDRGLSRLFHTELHWLDVTNSASWCSTAFTVKRLSTSWNCANTSCRCRITVTSSIRYPTAPGRTASPAQPMGFLCGWSVGLEFPAGQLAESDYWREQFQTISEDVSVRNVLMHSAH